MNKKLIKGFTLAETLIVITVLGIVAMLTVPNVIKQHMEAVARTKIKKSMTVYDLAITKMTVENDLRSDTELIKWSNEVDNCGNTVAYFKTANNKSCEFKTSDGVWWDISDIMNPIIALSEDELHKAQEEGINGKTSFKLVASFDRQSGAFRVDDIGYEKLKLETQLALAPEEQPEDVEENIEELELLFGFIDDKKDKNGDSDNVINENVCKSTTSCSGGSCKVFDCHGEPFAVGTSCKDSDITSCEYKSIDIWDSHGQTAYSGNCSDFTDITTCSDFSVWTHDDYGNQTAYGWNCSSTDIASCSYVDSVDVYDDAGNNIGTGRNCSGPNLVDCSEITYFWNNVDNVQINGNTCTGDGEKISCQGVAFYDKDGEIIESRLDCSDYMDRTTCGHCLDANFNSVSCQIP